MRWVSETGGGVYGGRVMVRPVLAEVVGGLSPTDPYVRRWWTAVLGPAAVTDLLRLHAAAERRLEIPHPTHLHMLVEAGLVRCTGRLVAVPARIPRLGAVEIARLPQPLRRTHTTKMIALRPQLR